MSKNIFKETWNNIETKDFTMQLLYKFLKHSRTIEDKGIDAWFDSVMSCFTEVTNAKRVRNGEKIKQRWMIHNALSRINKIFLTYNADRKGWYYDAYKLIDAFKEQYSLTETVVPGHVKTFGARLDQKIIAQEIF